MLANIAELTCSVKDRFTIYVIVSVVDLIIQRLPFEVFFYDNPYFYILHSSSKWNINENFLSPIFL